MAALYQKIYDPLTNERHASAKWWDSEDSGDSPSGHGSYSQYEGYDNGEVKEAFLKSVNEDNKVWTTDVPNRRPLTFAGAAKTVICDERPGELDYEEGYKYEQIEFSDRDKKTSAVFSQMLCDYVEKAFTVEAKTKFFDYGGKGRKWSQDKELMDRLEVRFNEVEKAYEGGDFALSLCDQSIKRSKPYPKGHFTNLLAKFRTFRENGPQFDTSALVFSPGKPQQLGLARTSPMKVAGVSVVAPSEPISWEKVQDDFQVLCKKLDSVIALSGPVVQAENV